MTAVNFAYWPRGFFEICGAGAGLALSGPQAATIKRHPDLVFAHEIDPSQGDPAHQAKLNEIHGGSATPPNDGDGSGPFDGHTLIRC